MARILHRSIGQALPHAASAQGVYITDTQRAPLPGWFGRGGGDECGARPPGSAGGHARPD